MLLYQCTTGRSEQHLTRLAKRAGRPLPDKIANKPRLHYGNDVYLYALQDLDSERSAGFGLSRIPWSTVHSYAVAHQLVGDALHDFVYTVTRVDAGYVEAINKRENDGKTAGDSQ